MAYIGKSPSGTGVRIRYYFTQTSGGATSISGTDDNNKTLSFSDGEYVDVYLNGVSLVAGTDYNTTTANTIGGLSALANGDVIEVVVYDIFTVADTVSQSSGGTFSGNVVFSGTTTGLDLNGTELVLDADADTSITAGTDDRIDFKTGGTDRVHISSTGVAGLGIGTTDPDPTSDGTAARAFLAVQGTLNRGCLALGTTSNSGGDVAALRFNNGSNVVASIGCDSDSGSTSLGNMQFFTNQTHRMTINSSGQVLIGDPTPNAAGSMLEIQTAQNTANVLYMLKTNQVEVTMGFKTAGDDNFYIGTGSSSIGTYGVYLTNQANSWSSISDERKKTIIEPIENASQKVSSLRTVIGRFNHDEDDKRRSFLIAQDVQAVLPEAVSVQQDEDSTLGLSYTDVIPLLTAALKESITKIETLETEITALKARVTALEDA